jgi:branched-subunit amino acid ABC-type transport system permease component
VNTVIVSGAFVGLIYGLLAVGLVVTYRASRIINFAYGETGMLAAMAYFDMRLGTKAGALTDHGILIALPAALLLGAAIGAAMEFFIARPLRDNPTLNGMVATIAASLLFLTYAIRRWGIQARPTKELVTGDGVRVVGITISPSQILILICAVVIIAGLGALYRYTSLGLRLRATALDPYAAALAGINTNTTAMGTWAIAGALSALSAILISPLVAMNVFFMTLLALRAFASALIGGLTSMWGAFTAGLLLGVLEAVVKYKSSIAGITDVAIAAGILVMLLVRPGGLVRAHY